MYVTDGDIGDNAKFKLKLRDVPNYQDVSKAFIVSPEEGQISVPVVITAIESNILDYDMPGNRELMFEVIAVVKDVAVSWWI